MCKDPEGNVYTGEQKREKRETNERKWAMSFPAFKKTKGTSKEVKEVSRIEEKLGHRCLPKAKGRSMSK